MPIEFFFSERSAQETHPVDATLATMPSLTPPQQEERHDLDAVDDEQGYVADDEEEDDEQGYVVDDRLGR